MFLLGVGLAVCLEVKEFRYFSELTFNFIRLQLRRMEYKSGALVNTGSIVGIVTAVS
jgi:hypothetical protein